MVACLDEEVGRVVAALERKGMRENTLILFHSDNGGTRNALFAGVMADLSQVKIPCDNGPYREGKGTLFEGGTRVCAFANWPGRIEPRAVDGMVHAVDLFATVAKLTGAPTTGCKPLDGLDVWETIAKGSPSPRTEIVYNVEPFRAAVRQGSWKLVWRTLLPSRAELYEIATDPSEAHDLAASNPGVVARLKARIEELARVSARPMFLLDRGEAAKQSMHGTPALPGEDEFYDGEDE